MKITNGRSLKKLLDFVFEEKNYSSFSESKRGFLNEEDKSQKSYSDNNALKSGDVNSSIIIDKLNTIRAGKSFKDSSIQAKMEKYVNDLSDAEKTALLAFLKGISQIVSGEVDDSDILDPGEPPAKVKMEKSKNQVVTVKPNVIKNSQQKEKEVTSDKEDTSGPAPIKAK
jgi:hypothetical protein